MFDLQTITAILAKAGIKIPETYLKEEIVRIIAESTTERVVEVPLVLRSIPPEPQTILDVGCRYSLVPIQLASLGHKISGIDINPYKKKHPNFEFYQADILKPPFKDKSFDIVTSLSTIEHIGLTRYKDARNEDGDIDSVDSIYNLLKPKGTLIITLPFGQATTTPWYRVYDNQRLNELLKKFKIQEKKAFWQKNGYWVPASIDDAEKVDSSQKAAAMVFVKAVKP